MALLLPLPYPAVVPEFLPPHVAAAARVKCSPPVHGCVTGAVATWRMQTSAPPIPIPLLPMLPVALRQWAQSLEPALWRVAGSPAADAELLSLLGSISERRSRELEGKEQQLNLLGEAHVQLADMARRVAAARSSRASVEQHLVVVPDAVARHNGHLNGPANALAARKRQLDALIAGAGHQMRELEVKERSIRQIADAIHGLEDFLAKEDETRKGMG